MGRVGFTVKQVSEITYPVNNTVVNLKSVLPGFASNNFVSLLCFSYMEALLYLIYAYQNNKELLSKGPYRGHDEELISHYRRECLLVSEG